MKFTRVVTYEFFPEPNIINSAFFKLRRLIISTDICKKCAECCKKYPFVALSENEISSLELVTGLHFSEFTNAKGKVGEGYFLQFKENGDCFFLNENKSGYSCGVYAARPGICKRYPSKPREKETCGGWIQITSAPRRDQGQV